MGQKTHPFGFRVGITETHKSRWFAPKALFGELLVEETGWRRRAGGRRGVQDGTATGVILHRERELPG